MTLTALNISKKFNLRYFVPFSRDNRRKTKIWEIYTVVLPARYVVAAEKQH